MCGCPLVERPQVEHSVTYTYCAIASRDLSTFVQPISTRVAGHADLSPSSATRGRKIRSGSEGRMRWELRCPRRSSRTPATDVVKLRRSERPSGVAGQSRLPLGKCRLHSGRDVVGDQRSASRLLRRSARQGVSRLRAGECSCVSRDAARCRIGAHWNRASERWLVLGSAVLGGSCAEWSG